MMARAAPATSRMEAVSAGARNARVPFGAAGRDRMTGRVRSPRQVDSHEREHADVAPGEQRVAGQDAEPVGHQEDQEGQDHDGGHLEDVAGGVSAHPHPGRHADGHVERHGQGHDVRPAGQPRRDVVPDHSEDPIPMTIETVISR